MITTERQRQIDSIRANAIEFIATQVERDGMPTEREMWRHIRTYQERLGLTGLDADHAMRAIQDRLVRFEQKGMKSSRQDAHDPS